MFFSEVNSPARWFALAASLMLGLTAAAQQAVQFTKPVDTDPASQANAFLPEKSHLSASAPNAPSSLFGDQDPTASFDILPGSPPPVVPSAFAAQWQKSMEDKKNWTMSTPEEILGITTPEKILGIADPNDDPRLSMAERYLQRLDRQAAVGASNALRRANAPLWQNGDPADPFLHNGDASTRFAATLEGSAPGSARNTARALFGQGPDGHSASDSTWNSPFDAPESLPKPTPKQLEGMDHFRALLEEQAVKPLTAQGFSVQPAATPDPIMQSMPAYNPGRHSFKALENDIAKPTGLAPLPGITGPVAPPKKAPPLVQPPPWMQDPLQNPILPQRQF